MDEDKFLKHYKCKECVHYRKLFYLENGTIKETFSAFCALGLSIEENDQKGCYKHVKNENEIDLRQLNAVEILLKLKDQLKNLKLLITKIENLKK